MSKIPTQQTAPVPPNGWLTQPHFCQKIVAAVEVSVWKSSTLLDPSLDSTIRRDFPVTLRSDLQQGPSFSRERKAPEKGSVRHWQLRRVHDSVGLVEHSRGEYVVRATGEHLGTVRGMTKLPTGWAMVGCKRHHEAVLRWAFMWFSRPWGAPGRNKRALGVSSTASLFHVVQPRVLALQCSCCFRPPFLAPQLLLGYMTRPADSVPGVIRCAPVCNWLTRGRTGAAAIALV